MMTQKRDYYEVLGVERGCSEQDLKSAYRRLALEHHPDRNPDSKDDSTERFKEITEAYGVLADPQKRAAYDHYGHAGLGGPGAANWPDFSSPNFSDFGDIIGDLFGVGDLFGRREAGRARARRGTDLQYELEIAFEEAARGFDTKIKIPRSETCGECGGRGARKGSSPVGCAACNGRGQVRHQQGFFTLTQTCPQCRGAGQVIRDACPECQGEGRVRREKVLGIKIPGGVDDGMRLRVSGEGEAGTLGGPPGDLYVVLRIREHAFFDRQGSDLYCTIPVSIAQATLGAEIKVPTLGGQERLRIPEGTQPGSVFRIRGCGVARVDHHGRGDLYVKIQVVTPTRLSREQRRLLESLGASMRIENKPVARRAAGQVKPGAG
ncbi:MAG TPA: molecular chaperone DnaJ [Terriglobia bacterium]|nr:molecular chaperone DnaJ [Terriglobia bacterium]